MDKKTSPTHMLSTSDPPQNKRPTQTKMRCWKKYSKQMVRGKKRGVAIFIPDKIDLKTKAIKRDREG